MKKTTAYLFAFIACMGLLWTCNKEEPPTIIKGKVTNSITGEPVEGASIAGTISNSDIGVKYKDNSAHSDSQGNYIYTIPSNYTGAIDVVNKEGFLPNVHPGEGHSFELGIENILDVSLIPEDGFVRLHLSNDLPGSDSVYVKFYSPIRQAQPLIGGYVNSINFLNNIPFNSDYEEIDAFPAEEYIKIYWDTKAFSPASTARYIDSIYLIRYDTVNFTIHF